MKDDVRRGRPPKYSDPEKFQAKIDEYFDKITTKDGEWIKPPTVSGLALFLGFLDRKSMYHYRDKDDFYAPVKTAIARIESFHEEQAAGGDRCAGNIFILKNFGWTDRVEHTGQKDLTIKWEENRTYKKDDSDGEAK